MSRHPGPPRVTSGLLRMLARRRPLSLAALVFLVLLVAVATAAPLIAPYNPLANHLGASLQGPSSRYLLGTDQLGRDTLSRLIYGARPTLLDAGEAVLVAVLLGLVTGLAAGFLGRVVDRLLVSATDMLMAMPGLVILLVVLTVFQSHIWAAMIALGFLLFPPLMRVVRASTLALRQEPFVDAARVAGLSAPRILIRHILPRIRGAVLVQVSVLCGMALLMTTGLAYLGFGTSEPSPSWGLSISEGAQISGSNSTLLTVSGILIALTVIACGVLGDGLRDVAAERWKGAPPKPTRRVRRAATGRGAAGLDAVQVGAEATSVLVLDGVDISYSMRNGPTVVVRDANLRIAPGESVGLVGESGSGKTAIARAVLGILRGGRVSAGRITLGGGGKVGYVSQEPLSALDPTWRVGALLAESVRHHDGRSSSETVRARVLDLLEQVRLPDPEAVARLYPHELSGGMAQRVAIARALVCRPALLIADEPTTALDVTVQAEILDLLRTLQAENGLAILLISHDWGVVADLCERAVVMYAGEIVEQGTIDSLFGLPAHPYTEGLLAANPAHVEDRTQPFPSIAGTIPSPEDWPSAGCHFRARCPSATDACATDRIQLLAIGAGHSSRCLRPVAPETPVAGPGLPTSDPSASVRRAADQVISS